MHPSQLTHYASGEYGVSENAFSPNANSIISITMLYVTINKFNGTFKPFQTNHFDDSLTWNLDNL